MKKSLLKSLIGHLSRESFKIFIEEFFGQYNKKGEPFYAFPQVGDGVYCRELLDSYGGSIHAIYLLHFLPIELFKDPKKVLAADTSIKERLDKIKSIYSGQYGQWGMVSPLLKRGKKLHELYFLSNFAGFTEKTCRNTFFPVYKNILKKIKLYPNIYGMGTCDSFVSKNPEGSEKAVSCLLLQRGEGLSISLRPDEQRIDRFVGEKSLAGGISQFSKIPYQPIFLLKEKQEAIREFEHLIRTNAKESEIEQFIASKYKDIFGPYYDRIETQIWLRFPEHDIADKERRLDVFLRNSVTNDWELYELKRATKLTCTYRDGPIIAHEVCKAVQQIKRYEKILSQDIVKKKLAEDGIEYCIPSLNLVIGVKPEIPHEQWRLLLNANIKDIKVITYDEILKQMECRVMNYKNLLEQQHQKNTR